MTSPLTINVHNTNGHSYLPGLLPPTAAMDPREAECLIVYEENLERSKDERDTIQKKTFTKWVNKHLKKSYLRTYTCCICRANCRNYGSPAAGRKVDDLFLDLQDGNNLISLLEVLSQESLPRQKGRMRFHKLENVQSCLDFLKHRKIKLVNIRAEDIVDGNPKLTLGLIWTIILHFQVSEPWGGENTGISAKEALLQWAQRITHGYPGVSVKNFTTSWRDGLAFNAVLHRYRPELVNWRQVRQTEPRERLDSAFTLAEREFGVTRLLDPEDVDIQMPDEHSLITYISSLYDALPEQTATPRYENDMTEYRLRAREFLLWIHKVMQTLHEKGLPSHVVELKQQLQELQNLRNQDLATRIIEKQELEVVYSKLESLFGGTGQWSVEEELNSSSLDRAWSKLLETLDDREQLIQERIRAQTTTQEFLSRLAKDIKSVNEKLDVSKQRLDEAESRIHILSPTDMKELLDSVALELTHLESPLTTMFQDAEYLKTSRHPQANECYRQVFNLHQRRVSLLQRCQGQLMTELTQRTEHLRRVEEERYTQSRTRVFSNCERCIEWVEEITKRIERIDFVEELQVVEETLEKHRGDHRIVMDFRHEVDQCISRQAEVSAEDSGLYCDLLSSLEENYEQLRQLSTGRILDLDSLVAFIRAATQELLWLNEREEIEVTRDWSDINRLDLPMLQNYCKQLRQEIELREDQFNAVYNQGSALIKQQHPAAKTIESYLATMHSQWDWLLSLNQCLHNHLQDAGSLKLFIDEARVCEQWMDKQWELLSTQYERTDFMLEDGEKYLKELDDIREMLQKYNEVLVGLLDKCQNIPPLWKRRDAIPRAFPVIALCNYSDRNLNVRKGDECLLLSNTDPVKWVVRVPEGVDVAVPSVVLRLPPPDERIYGYLNRLRAQFDRLRKLWLEKQRKVRLSMVLITIRLVRGWDLKQFLSIESEHREAIMKALNDDTTRLLSELDQNDPLAATLHGELEMANDHFYSLLQQEQKGPEPDVNSLFDKKVVDLLTKLEESWRILNKRVHDNVPKSSEKLEDLIIEHKDFEDALQALDSDVSMVQELFRQLREPSPLQRSRIDTLMSKWESLWDLSRMYVERLKSIEHVLNGLVESAQLVTEYEKSLSAFDTLPSSLELLRGIHSQLLELQLVLKQQQPVLDTLAEDVGHMRQHVSRTRVNVADHPDVDRVEDDVQKVTVRWENVCMQVVQRLKMTEVACQIVLIYRSEYDTELSWLSRVEQTINNLRDAQHLKPEEFQAQMDILVAEYSNLQERTGAIENVNRLGGKFIREAKQYDMRLDQFRYTLADFSRSSENLFDSRRHLPTPGAEIVAKELEELNRRFAQLSSFVLERQNVIKVLMQQWKRQQQVDQEQLNAAIVAQRRNIDASRLELQVDSGLGKLHVIVDERVGPRESESVSVSAVPTKGTAQPSAEIREIGGPNGMVEPSTLVVKQKPVDIVLPPIQKLPSTLSAVPLNVVSSVELAPEQRSLAEVIVAQSSPMRRNVKTHFQLPDFGRSVSPARVHFTEDAVPSPSSDQLQHKSLVSVPFDGVSRDCEEFEPKDSKKTRFNVPDLGRAVSPARIHLFDQEPVSSVPESSFSGGLHLESFFPFVPFKPILIQRFEKSALLEEIIQHLDTTVERSSVTEAEDQAVLYEEWTETKTTFYELHAVKHTQTGEILTFVEAMRQGMLDLSAGDGQFLDSSSGNRISLREAVERGYVSQSFNDCLQTKYGIRDPVSSKELTLLEAIQKGVYDPESRQLRDVASGELLNVTEAIGNNVIAFEDIPRLVRIGILKMPPIQLEDAINQGILNADTGVFMGKFTGKSISLKEALVNNYIAITPPPATVLSGTITLSEAIEQKFIDPVSAEFHDKTTDEKLTLVHAMSRTPQLINTNVKEVVDTRERKRITVSDAVAANIIDVDKECFTDSLQQKSMSLADAFDQCLIQKPMTLTEVVQRNLVDSTGRIVDVGTKRRLSLLESVAEGVIDPYAPHIVDPLYKDTISVTQALARGILQPEGTISAPAGDSSQSISLSRALQERLLVDAVKNTVFDVKGIRNTSNDEYLSFNEAADTGILDISTQRFNDTANNQSLALADAAHAGLVDSALYVSLNSPVGIQDHEQNQLTVFDAVSHGLIDHKTGSVISESTSKPLSPREAYQHGLISLRGAVQLSSLVNILPSSAATKLSSPSRVPAQERTSTTQVEGSVTLQEAIDEGLIDVRTHRFRHGDQETSLLDAICLGLIDPRNEWIVPANNDLQKIAEVQEKISEKVSEIVEILPPKRFADKKIHEIVTTSKRTKLVDTTATGGPSGLFTYRALKDDTQTIKLPIQGLDIGEAVQRGLLHASSGLLRVPNSDKVLALQEAVHLGVINAEQVIIDNETGRQLSVSEAFESKLMDSFGRVSDPTTNRKLNLAEALAAGLVELVQSPKQFSTKLINFGFDEKSPTTVLSVTPCGDSVVDESHKSLRFSAKTGEVTDLASGRRMAISEAIREGAVPKESIIVKDALTERVFTYSEAVKWGIIDAGELVYNDKKSGHQLSLQAAATAGLLSLAGSKLDSSSAEISQETVLKERSREMTTTQQASIVAPPMFIDYNLSKLIELGWYSSETGLFTHPDTRKQLTLKEALLSGFFNPYKSSVIDQLTGRELSLLDAIEFGVIDAASGQLVNLNNGSTMPLDDALQKNLLKQPVTAVPLEKVLQQGLINVLSGSVSLSDAKSEKLNEAIEEDRIDPMSVAIVDPVTVKQMSFAEGIHEGIVGPSGGVVKNIGNGENISFVQALNDGILRPAPISVQKATSVSCLKTSREVVPPSDKVAVVLPLSSMASTSVKSKSQIAAVELSAGAELIGIDQVRDTRTGRVLSLAEGQRAGMVKVDRKGKELSRTYASFRTDLSSALQCGIVDARTGHRLSLSDAIRCKLVDIEKLQYVHPSSGDPMNLVHAANIGLVDLTLAEMLPKGIHVPSVSNPINLSTAVSMGVVDRVSGKIRDPKTNQEVDWYNGLLPAYVASKTEGVYDPRTGEMVTLLRAINDGLLDLESSAYRDPLTGETQALQEACNGGLIHKVTFNVLSKPSVLNWKENNTINLIDAIREGIVDPKHKTIQIGDCVVSPVSEAAAAGMLTMDVAHVLEQVQKLSYTEALGRGLIDTAARTYFDADTGQHMSLSDAEQRGYIDVQNVKSPVALENSNLANVLSSEEMDPNSGRIRNPKTGAYLKFKDAVNRGLIDGDSIVYDTDFGNTLTVCEALSSGRISDDGKLIEASTGRKLSLPEALKIGALAVIAAPMMAGHAIAEAMKKRDVEGVRFRFEGSDSSIRSKSTTPSLFSPSSLSTSTQLSSPSSSVISKREHSPTAAISSSARNFGNLQREFVRGLQQSGIDVAAKSILVPGTKQRISINEAVDSGVLDMNTGELVDVKSGRRLSIPKAIAEKLIPTPVGEQLVNQLSATMVTRSLPQQSPHDITEDVGRRSASKLVSWRGQPTAEMQKEGLQALSQEELQQSCATVEHQIDQLLLDIGSVEQLMAEGLQHSGHSEDDLKAKIQRLEALRSRLAADEAATSSCLSEAELIIQNKANMLSPEEFHNLRRHREQLQEKHEAALHKTTAVLNRLKNTEELTVHFNEEVSKLRNWSKATDNSLTLLLKSVGDFQNLPSAQEEASELHEDVLFHNEDFQSIVALAHHIQEEIKGYLQELGSMRAVNSRLPSTDQSTAEVRDTVSSLTTEYQALNRKCDLLKNLLDAVEDRGRHYESVLELTNIWLSDMEQRAEPYAKAATATDPTVLRLCIAELTKMNAEVASKQSQLDEVKNAGDNYLAVLRDQKKFVEVRDSVMNNCNDLENRYHNVKDKLNDYGNALQASLVRCQDIQENIGQFSVWLSELNVPDTFALPLSKEKLSQQLKEQRIMMSDIDGHKQALESITSEVQLLLQASPNSPLHSQLLVIASKYQKAATGCKAWGEQLNQAADTVDQFHQQTAEFETWLAQSTDQLTCKELSKQDLENFEPEVDRLLKDVQHKAQIIERLRHTLSAISALPNAVETGPLKEKLRELEKSYADTVELANERRRQLDERQRKVHEFDEHLTKVQQWLQKEEQQIEELQFVALDADVVRQQMAELDPLVSGHNAFKPEIDKLSKLGQSYVASLHPVDSSAEGKRAKRDHRLPGTANGALSPSSTESSGFSSFDTIHTIEELSPIQQRVFDSKQRYELHGARLADRSSELDHVKMQLDRLQRDSQKFTFWMDSMRPRMSTCELPFTRDDAVKDLDEAKVTVEDVQKGRVQLEDIRSQAHELTRLKSDVPGLNDVNEHVLLLNQNYSELVEDCNGYQQTLLDAKDFYVTHSGLHAWLLAKRKMIAVLGPVATDLSHLNNQCQQVLVLSEEFNAQAPQVEVLNQAGKSLMDRVPFNSDAGRMVADQLSDINQRWGELLDKLEERQNSLQDARELCTDLSTKQAELKLWLASASEQVAELTTSPTSTVEIDEQLALIQQLSLQFSERSKDLEVVVATAEQLCDISGDPMVKSEVHSRLLTIQQPFEEMRKKLHGLEFAVNASMAEGLQFEEQLKELFSWVNSSQSALSHQLPLSADVEKLTKQVEDFEVLYQDILSHDGKVQYAKMKGLELLKKNDDPVLRENLSRIEEEFEPLLKAAKDQKTSIERALDDAKQHDVAQQSLSNYCTEIQAKLSALKAAAPGANKAAQEAHLKNIQEVLHDIIGHKQEHKSALKLAENLMKRTQSDHLKLQDQRDALHEQWEQLNRDSKGLEAESVRKLELLAEFNAALVDSSAALTHCEELVDKTDAHDSRSLAKLKSVLQEAESGPAKHKLSVLKEAFAKLKSSGQGEVVEPANLDQLESQISALTLKYESFTGELQERIGQLELASDMVKSFKQDASETNNCIKSLQDDFAELRSLSRDPHALKLQLEQTHEFLQNAAAKSAQLETLKKNIEELRSKGFETDAEVCSEQVSRMQHQLEALNAKAESRLSDGTQLQDSLGSILYGVRNLRHDISETLGADLLKRGIIGDMHDIKQQLEHLKLFKDGLEPIARQVDSLSEQGRDLVKSAGPGVDTSLLEEELDAMLNSWNELKSYVASKEEKLNSALLGLGNFEDSLSNLESWLSETEELIGGQKPPSADHKVVKAQLQEQKLVLKLIDDKQNHIENFRNTIDQIAQFASEEEKEALRNKLVAVLTRYDVLAEDAHDRRQKLQETLELSEQWMEHLEPFLSWLDNAEKQLQKLDTVPTDEEKLNAQIEDHKNLHEEIVGQRDQMDAIVDLGQCLRILVCEEDAENLDNQIGDLALRYDRLGATSQALGVLLTQMVEGVTNFLANTEELGVWLDDMELKMKGFEVISVFVDSLEKQSEDLVVLAEEVANNQERVVFVVEEGHDLCKHTSGDEAIALQSRLDNLRIRYSELSKKADQRLALMQDALPMAEQFHDCNQKLSDWLQAIETDLTHLDEVDMDQQHELIQGMTSDINGYRQLLEIMNSNGARLGQLSPGEGMSTLEGITSRTNKRFDNVCEQIQRRAERLNMSRQRSLEVLHTMDDLSDWFQQVENQMSAAGAASSTPNAAREQLKEQKKLNDDIVAQKVRVRDMLAKAKQLQRELTGDDSQAVADKVLVLKELAENVSNLSADRLSVLEQALPLAEHFADAFDEVNQWLNSAEIELENSPAVTSSLQQDQIKRQQEHNNLLQQQILENRPLVEKLNKTGGALGQLCNEDDAVRVSDILDQTNMRFEAVRENVRARGAALDDAWQQTSQFSDKLDGILQALSTTAQQMNQAEPVAAHPAKIKDQIRENEAIVAELKQRTLALEAVKLAADDIVGKADPSDAAVAAVQAKMLLLDQLWTDIARSTEARGSALCETLAVAERFWQELNACIDCLNELKRKIGNSEEPGLEPDVLAVQREELKAFEDVLNEQQPHVDACKVAGHVLLEMVGEPEKPEVQQRISELDNAWETVTAAYYRRNHDLIEAMEKAMAFHELKGDTVAWLTAAEKQFSTFAPVAMKLQEIQDQAVDLEHYKSALDQNRVHLELMNAQANELMRGSSADQHLALLRPVQEINKRWDTLGQKVADRQKCLEKALLQMGHFEQAYNQLMEWLKKSNDSLGEIEPAPGDLKQIEVDLAKLRVLQNDVHMHQTSVDTIHDAGRKLLEANMDSPEETQQKLVHLNQDWNCLLENLAQKHAQLETAKTEAQSFTGQISDWLAWLGDVDSALSCSKPTGGLPETAREQLERFLVLKLEIEENEPKVDSVLVLGEEYIRKSPENEASALGNNIKLLKQRWQAAKVKADDRRKKLDIAMKDAENFHEMHEQLITWLTDTEKHLSALCPVSRVLEPLTQQLEEQKVLREDVSEKRELLSQLDKKGTQLKYYCQKQDVILIKNLLVSAQHRFEKVASRVTERSRQLEAAYAESSEFHNNWNDLCYWLDGSERTLEEEQQVVANNPEKIREQLSRHKEFQRSLAERQVQYDATNRQGKLLRDRAPKEENPVIQEMLNELREKWNTVSNCSMERQRKLEEALLFSGQFKEALRSLMEWLDKNEPLLVETLPVCGDLDTVTTLRDQQMVFLVELKVRAAILNTVRRSAVELEITGDAQSADEIHAEMQVLNAKWDSVSELTKKMTRKLDNAFADAESFHKQAHMLLEFFADIELKLKYAGSLPEDVDKLNSQLSQLQQLKQELEQQQSSMNAATNLGREILDQAHANAVQPMTNWLRILKTRWEEVNFLWQQREDRIKDQLKLLKDQDDLLTDLLQWLKQNENRLQQMDEEPIPEDMQAVEKLMQEHQEFQEGLRTRQPEVEEATKARRRADAEQVVKTGKDAKTGKTAQTIASDGPKNPKIRHVSDKWRQVWLQSMERHRKLQDMYNYLQELEKIKNFSFDEWRLRYMDWMNNKKSRVMDFFRRQDKDNDGKVTREEFIDGILQSKFPTNRLEMNAVADIFDKDKDGYIDYKEFIAALRPDRESYHPLTEQEKIKDEVQRQVQLCTCHNRYKVKEVGEGKYKFGENQQLRLVRILRSTVMVRVGGGWVALDEFLVKNDPCRAKGRTNIELREKFILPEGASQTMVSFRARGSPHTAGSQASSGSSSRDSPHFATPGPVIKIKQRTQERSTPMFPQKVPGTLSQAAHSSRVNGHGHSSPPDSEVSSIMSNGRRASCDILNHTDQRSASRRSGRGGPCTNGSIGSRPSSRSGSSDIPVLKPGSSGSRPPSRAGSDISDASRDSLSCATPTRIPSYRKKYKK